MINNDLNVSKNAICAHYWCVRKAHLVMFSPELSSPTAYENMLATLSGISRQNYLHSLAKQSKVIESFSPLTISKGADLLTT